MQSPSSAQPPAPTHSESSIFGKINLFTAPPNANNRAPITSSDAFRFQVGVNYKAKVIGIEEVEEARGDRMCQIAIQKQKAFIKATGAHKQRIQINVSLEGIKLVDQVTGATLHHHPVQRISFISRDVSDARAFGYIYGPGDGTHKFFGIKTEKAAENVVLTLRDLFQVVFEMKKKESEDEKKLKLDREPAKTEQKPTNEAPKPEEEAEPEKKEEAAASSGLLELETEMINLGFGQASQPQDNDFDPLTSGGGGGSVFSAQPQNTQNTFAQGFGGAPFASSSGAMSAPVSQQFSSPANMNQPPQQAAWATFSPTNTPVSQPPTNPTAFPAQPPQQPAMGGFGGPSPFGVPQSQPAMQSSNPFGSGFGAPAASSGFGGPTGASFGGDPFGGGGSSLLEPTVSQQPTEPEPPKPPKREDMFSNLVDGFGADFGKKKEEAPPTKMNDMIPKPKQASSGFSEVEGFGDSDPFDTTSVQKEIRAQEMETAPNVYTKQISFSESENDLTPDQEVPAPTLPPPPLPSSVHSSHSTLHYPTSDYTPAPTPPPRPSSGQTQHSGTSTPPFPRPSSGLHGSTPPLPRRDHSPATPPMLRGQTVDLGACFPDAPPPPPPPRSTGGTLSRQAVSYSAVPRPHPSPKFRHAPAGCVRASPHSSPLLQRQTTAPSLSHPPTHSPNLGHQRRLHSDQNNYPAKLTPPVHRKQEFFPASDVKDTDAPAQAQANFADFSNFSQQISTSSGEVMAESPPPPPRQGSDRQKAPKLSSQTRSLTMPTHKGDSHDTCIQSGNKIGSPAQVTSTATSDSNPDPFALTLPNPKKTRNVDAAYARPRPKARSKTPTLISTKTKSKSSLSAALRSESPLSQNSVSSREFEASELVPKTAVQRNDTPLNSSNSPKEVRGSQVHRTGTPVSMNSMQSASSGQSSEPAPDPFAHVDPFETKDTADPFVSDPFMGPDPFKSPSDPFSKDMTEAEFKTKAIAITADGLEVSEETASAVNGNTELKPDPDPFGRDPFSLGADPFQGRSGLQLGRPLIGGIDQVTEQTCDPFDTAHIALNKPSTVPEFSNNAHSGIAGIQSNSHSQDLFKDFHFPAKSSHNQNQQPHDTWVAEFSHTESLATRDKDTVTGINSQYCQTHPTPSQSSNPSHHLINANHEHNVILSSPPLSHSPANHPGCHGNFTSRERHESDSTSYNSEISEAFASSATVTSPSLANQTTAVNGRGTPGNPFLTNTASTPVQNPVVNAPIPTSGSLLDF